MFVLSNKRSSMNIFTTTNSCAGIALDDCDELNRAAERFLDARNVVIKIAESFGDAASWAGGYVADAIKDKLGIDVEERLQGHCQTKLAFPLVRWSSLSA